VTRALSINLTQLADAGEYLCAEQRSGAGIVDASSAQFTVLGRLIMLAMHSVIKYCLMRK